MGAPPTVYSEALRQACAYVRRYPKLAHWANNGDSSPALAAFLAEPAVRRYRRHMSERHWSRDVAALLDKADDYVNHGGQAERVFALYRAQLEAGSLVSASDTRRAVHRAVFSLAAHQGAPLLASLRRIQALAAAQSGIKVSHAVVGRHVRALSEAHLFHYVPGKAGLRPDSGKIELDLVAEPDIGLDHEAVSALVLGPEEILALREFEEQSKRNVSARSDAARAPHLVRRALEADRALAELESALAQLDWSQPRRPST